MPIRIGANPIGWSNDDLQDIGGATPLETCLAEAREAGFVGMELGHKFPREPKALKAALDPFGMACISGWYSAELLARDADEEMKHLRAQAVMEQARREDWSFLDAILGKGSELGVYTVPGDGMVDYTSVFKALPGYSGWVVVEAEQDPQKAHPLTYAKKGVAHLEQSLKEAGLA